jgi:hypothetical protein
MVGQHGHELIGSRSRKVLRDLKADNQIKAPTQLERLFEIVPLDAIGRHEQLLSGRPTAFDALDIVNARGRESRQPSASTGPNVEHRPRREQLDDDRHDEFS